MELFSEAALSAYFPGLVEVCVNDEGELVYAIIKNGELIFAREFVTETETFSPPEKKHFPFTLPRASEVLRYYEKEDETLYNDLLCYLKRFSALDDEQWAIVAHYVFLTYLHDHHAIDYCPYILFHAVPERGKSRTGKSLAYVAFRGIHLVELREANIFRYSQNLHGTLFFDLMDISKKADRNNCVDILLSRYEKGAKCNRVIYPDQGPFNDTVYYDIYGPTIIASNEQLNKTLESRCLPIVMPNRPGSYENPRPDLALELKERLTAWRAKNLNAKLPDMEPMEGISGRLWDITKPLFLINSLLPKDDYYLKRAILSISGEKDESRKDSVEGRLVSIIKEITEEEEHEEKQEWSIKIGDIREKYNKGKPEDRQASPQWIGKRLKSMSLRHRILKGYAEIKITAHEYALLLKQYGQAGRESSENINSLPHSLPENNEENQTLLREVESGRECPQVYPPTEFESPGDREFYEEFKEQMETKQLSADEIKYLEYESLEEWKKRDDIPF